MARSTTLELRSAGETGYVFLACALEGSDNKCSVDTGNALNSAVADFRSGGSQTAKVTVTSGDSSRRGDADTSGTFVMVTAHTISGEQSHLAIPLE